MEILVTMEEKTQQKGTRPLLKVEGEGGVCMNAAM